MTAVTSLLRLLEQAYRCRVACLVVAGLVVASLMVLPARVVPSCADSRPAVSTISSVPIVAAPDVYNTGQDDCTPDVTLVAATAPAPHRERRRGLHLATALREGVAPPAAHGPPRRRQDRFTPMISYDNNPESLPV